MGLHAPKLRLSTPGTVVQELRESPRLMPIDAEGLTTNGQSKSDVRQQFCVAGCGAPLATALSLRR
jgi:hypothetical protein